MKLYCPYCAKEITPDTIQCASCKAPYGLEVLLLIRNLVRTALSAHPAEQKKCGRAIIPSNSGKEKSNLKEGKRLKQGERWTLFCNNSFRKGQKWIYTAHFAQN